MKCVRHVFFWYPTRLFKQYIARFAGGLAYIRHIYPRFSGPFSYSSIIKQRNINPTKFRLLIPGKYKRYEQCVLTLSLRGLKIICRKQETIEKLVEKLPTQGNYTVFTQFITFAINYLQNFSKFELLSKLSSNLKHNWRINNSFIDKWLRRLGDTRTPLRS